MYVIYGNGNKFKINFALLCDQFDIKHKPTMVMNPQAQAVLKCIHALLSSMLHRAGLEDNDDLSFLHIEKFIIDTAWDDNSTHHNVLGSSPGATLLG